MFTSEFDAEVDESESATLQQYYREAMIQGYNFGFEVRKQKVNYLFCGFVKEPVEVSVFAVVQIR